MRRCAHGRYAIDPCLGCGRRYRDGKLVGPFVSSVTDYEDTCVVCGLRVIESSPAALLAAMVEHYDAHPLD